MFCSPQVKLPLDNAILRGDSGYSNKYILQTKNVLRYYGQKKIYFEARSILAIH